MNEKKNRPPHPNTSYHMPSIAQTRHILLPAKWSLAHAKVVLPFPTPNTPIFFEVHCFCIFPKLLCPKNLKSKQRKNNVNSSYIT